MTGWLYVVACVVAPGAWGILMYLAFGAVERHRRRRDPRPTRPPIDYSI